MVANCLRSAGVGAYDTRDALQRHRLAFVYVTICLYCTSKAYVYTDIYAVCIYHDVNMCMCRFHHASPSSRFTRAQDTPEGYSTGMLRHAMYNVTAHRISH